MNRRAIGKLAALPFVRMPAGMILVGVVWLISLILIPTTHTIAIPFVGMVTWLVGMLLGMTMRTLMRTDTLLLPDFARILGQTGLLYALVLIVAPALLLFGVSGNVQHALLMAAVQLLAVALGLASGTGFRITLFVWIVFPLVGLLPADVHAIVLHALTTSYWVPLLATLLALLLLHFILRPLLTVSDREGDDSPMQAIADGRKPAVTASGAPQHKGWIARKLQPVMDTTAQRSLTHALTRFRKSPTRATRMAVVRAVLLPHDNLYGMLINVVVTTLLAGLYFAVFLHDSHRHGAGYLASYAVIFSMMRFAAVGRGMQKMQPNLADLYMTLAPQTHREFQATMADALLKLIITATISCVSFAVLIALLLHAQTPAELILTALIIGIGTSFAALAAHLIGPTTQGGRAMMQITLIVGAMLVFNLVLWLMHRFGILVGGLAGIVICLPFGLGAWQYARREYLTRRPCFDASLD
ncbi:MAG TPA: hypothetical protein VFK31_04690 [Rhodanobacteraceae bacterium]|nr:hypothetical protein [Rhodanobacteraceae bacterium]